MLNNLLSVEFDGDYTIGYVSRSFLLVPGIGLEGNPPDRRR